MPIKVKEKAKIELKKLDFQLHDDDSSDAFVQSLNYVPLLFLSKLNDVSTPPINGTTIDPKDIIYVKLHNSRFLPEIELFCDDSKGILFNDLYPFDHDTILSIFVKANSENIMPIRMDFRVTEYETIKSKDSMKYLIRGILDVDELHYTRYEAKKGSSYDVIKELALQMNLGFASNIDSSDDEMKWINPSDTYVTFITDITKRAFVSEDTFVWSFIDFYYNINYVDIGLELDQKNSSELSTSTNAQVIKNDTEERNTPAYLTNNKAFNMTNKFIDKFNLVNQSFKVNLESFYKIRATWYDKNENKIYRDFIKDIDEDLKSDDNIKILNDYTSPIYEESINDEYFIGKINTDNTHKNYALMHISNKYNLEKLEKMKMVVTLNQINFDIKRFQNLKVEIYNTNDLFSKNATKKAALNNINQRLSGFWFVTGINYLYKRNSGVEQEVTLVRKDLSLNYGDANDEKNDFRRQIKDDTDKK